MDKLNNTVRVVDERHLRDVLFHAGDQWGDTLTSKQIDNVINSFKQVEFKVIYDNQ